MIAKALLAKASEGDVRAIAELANRTEGKPPQAMALDLSSDPDSNEITVRFVRPEELTSEEIDAELSRLEDRTGFTAMKEKIRELEEQLAKAGIPDRKF
jgi:ferritin-like protein